MTFPLPPAAYGFTGIGSNYPVGPVFLNQLLADLNDLDARVSGNLTAKAGSGSIVIVSGLATITHNLNVVPTSVQIIATSLATAPYAFQEDTAGRTTTAARFKVFFGTSVAGNGTIQGTWIAAS